MYVYCDAAYSKGEAGIGIAVVSYGIILYRDSVKIPCRDVFTAELEALERGISLGISIRAERVVTDAQYLITAIRTNEHSRGLSKLFSLAHEYEVGVDWVHREKNKIADGLAKAALRGIDWRKEITEGSNLKVKPLNSPLAFSVDGEVVNKEYSIWHCSCKDSKKLRGMSLDCKHIVAVKRSLGEFNQSGELIKYK